MPREAIANHPNAGRDRGPRLRNPIEGAATAWEAIFRDAIGKKFRTELTPGSCLNSNSIAFGGGR